jgi:UTP:GlnB (protein PII) uridylyltransferase
MSGLGYHFDNLNKRLHWALFPRIIQDRIIINSCRGLKGLQMHEIVQDILDKFRALLAAQVPLHRLILFGSRARGDAEPFSDIDVLVVVDSGLDDQIRELVSDCAW